MDDAAPKMRFSLSPPPAKADSATMKSSRTDAASSGSKSDDEATSTIDEAASDYKQWLHAMKLVARLPGGMPPEFRRKLWFSLADKYLKAKNVDWAKEEEKCFCEKWREDDDELGIQIVKDLHRTGSNLCTGPAGNINQAKLKRILLGYARYNPEVGYCQGFNMLGALILQVMDKEEAESIKVMIYLVEGVLPPGYFCGSMGGLQADMGVFRELMTSKLPRLAKHLQKLQGPLENAYEPPLTNVFTMQWFLTMFCTCLPMTCVLRVWDLVLIEGSDVLLRTALVLWSLLEERILCARTADDFYCKMGSFSSELLNGHLVDSNGLIEKVVQLGPIPDIQRLRDKHLYNIAPLRNKQGLQLYFDEEEPESDEESRLAVATVWGIPWGRRGSGGHTSASKVLQPESKDRLALDISLLKKQYDRLRERQKQAHIILTTACSTAARQSVTHTNPALPVNQLLMGRSAIVTNRGRRVGPPAGAIPPARKPSLPAILHKPPEKQLRRGETLHWRDMDISKRRRDSLTWKEIKADRLSLASHGSSEDLQSRKIRTRMGKSDSSSYSEEESDGEASSTDTSLCDEDDPVAGKGKSLASSSTEKSPKKRDKISRKQKELTMKLKETTTAEKEPTIERKRPKSWGPTNDEIPFMLMSSDSPVDEGKPALYNDLTTREDEDSATECDRTGYKFGEDFGWTDTKYSRIAGDLATCKLGALHIQTDVLELPVITSAVQLSPIPNISNYLDTSAISPMPNASGSLFLDSINSLGSGDGEDAKNFDVNEDGVTNEYFERVNNVERPTQLDLFYSLSEEDSIRNAYELREEGEENPENSTQPAEIVKSEIEMSNPGYTEEEEVIEQCEATHELKEKPKNDTFLNEQRKHSLDNPERSIIEHEDKIEQKESDLDRSNGYNEQHRLMVFAEREHPTTLSKQYDDNDNKTREFIKNSTEDGKYIHRKYSFNESLNKRRDPRRLTIARSFTIDSEDKHLRTNTDFEYLKELANPEKKTVPSTEELEDRFKKLEKQLSENKKTSENSLRSDESMESLCPDNSRSSAEIDAINLKGRYQSRIPSTVELEDRFNNLERQLLEEKEKRIESQTVSQENSQNEIHSENVTNLKPATNKEVESETTTDPDKARLEKTFTKSLSSGENNSSKKSPSTLEPVTSLSSPSSSSKETIARNDKSSECENKEISSQDGRGKTRMDEKISSQSRETETDTRNDSPKVAADKVTGGAKSQNLPTTAELEDRYNALERKQSVPKKTSLKNGKEPPDEMVKNGGKDHTSPADQDGTTERKKADIARTESKVSAKTKSPPSTEELEKRFEALERTLSSDNTTSSKKEVEYEDKKPTKGSQKGGAEVKSGKSQERTESKSQSSQLLSEKYEAAEKKATKERSASDDSNEKSSSKNLPAKADPIKKDKTTLDQTETKRLAVKGFHAQCNIINDQLEQAEKAPKASSSEQSSKNEPKSSKEKFGAKEVRRASEPPTTEDLENRYEAITRRMSTKPFSQDASKQKMLERPNNRVEKAAQDIEESTSVETDAPQEKTVKSQQKSQPAYSNNEAVEKISNERATSLDDKETRRRSSEPPTTEELEKRYENLKRRMSAKADTLKESSEETEDSRKIHESKLITKSDKIAEKKLDAIEPTVEFDRSGSSHHQSKKVASENKEHEESLRSDVASASQEQEGANIPVPPPMQTKPYKIVNSWEHSQRRALVAELQRKMTPNDENLKPSDINPNRKPTKQRRPLIDETSEAHAAALRRLKKDESWHVKPHKMVRRFSDLPSRADLENRVNFLEQQLSLKLIKQRSASDSEVTSKTRSKGFRGDSDGPGTSPRLPYDVDLENRVRALEKQLSENSLKLFETTEQKPKINGDQGANNPPPEPDPQTGMELVRYTHYGEIEESEATRPINISINIKMHLNRDSEEKRQKAVTNATTTEDLEKRLEVLEEQLLKSRQSKSGEIAELAENNKEILKQAPEGSFKENDGTENQTISDTAQHLEEERPVEKVVTTSERETNSAKKDSQKVLKTTNQTVSDSVKHKEKEKPVEEVITTAESKSSPAKKDNQVSTQTTNRTVSDKVQNKETKRPDDKAVTATSDIENNASRRDTQHIPQTTDLKEGKTLCKETNERELQNQAGTKSCSTINVEENSQQTQLGIAPEEAGAEDLPIDEIQSKVRPPASAEQPTAKVEPSTSTKNGKPEDREGLQTSDLTEVIKADSKNMVLLLENDPKPVKVRRLTRANTEELEGLLQALEKQLNERNLIKSDSGKLVRIDSSHKTPDSSKQSQAITDLSKEIQEFTSSNQNKKQEKPAGKKEVEEEEFDWGPDPVKRHLKRSTVYLPSTKELVARYRSLERQIRLLEDVEKIDVEQRLNEIERKIKLQYSLSHEKDLFKFLDLCEGKLPDDEPAAATPSKNKTTDKMSSTHTSPSRSRSRSREKSPYISPSYTREGSPYTSPSPSRKTRRSPYGSPVQHRDDATPEDLLPSTEDLEYRYRALELVRSKSKEGISTKAKTKSVLKKQPIHPLEMLLDPSPVESDVPTTGELEHRIRVLDDKTRKTPSPPRKSLQRSPTIEDIKRQKMIEGRKPKSPIHNLETLVASPTKKEPPTEQELEARMRALMEEQKFDFKMQKNFREFNQKLKDVISPSLSFEEFKAAKSREESPKRPPTPKSAIKDYDVEHRRHDNVILRTTSPKAIRFRDDEDRRPKSSAGILESSKMVGTADGVLKIIEENSKMLQRILKKTLADSNSSSLSDTRAAAEGLGGPGLRLMRETSPLRRTGTHTGVPLRTDDNINDRLNSIKNTIKSIDSLCEEKPYRRGKCERYIDSLCNESAYFATPSQKSSLEDLSYNRRSGEYAPSIHISDHSQRLSEQYLSRSVGSAESIRSGSPVRAASPLHHRSTRDLRRDISPRRRYGDEEREEYESRVRTRVNLLPKYYLDDSSESLGRSSLTKFHNKVDNELDTYKFDGKARSSSRSVSRSPLRSPYGLRETVTATSRDNITLNNSHNTDDNTPITKPTTTTPPPPPQPISNSKSWEMELRSASPHTRPMSSAESPLSYDSSLVRSGAPAYTPSKLEIRHTTVTSTFYDRLLAEKQIEKSLSRPQSKSPVVSPSVASKGYIHLSAAGSNVTSKSSGLSPTTSVYGPGGVSFGPVAGNLPTTNASDSASAITNNTNTVTANITNLTFTSSSLGNSAILSNSYLPRLPSITDSYRTDLGTALNTGIASNIQTSSMANIATAPSMPTTITTNTYTPFTQMFSISTCLPNTTTTTTAITSGIYIPGLLHQNLKPSSEIGIQLGQHQLEGQFSTSSNHSTSYDMNLSKS